MRPILFLILSCPGLTFVPNPLLLQRASNVLPKSSRTWVPLINIVPETTIPRGAGLLDSLRADDDFTKEESDAYEQALGTLVFGAGDPTMEIAQDLDTYDEKFSRWLLKKTDATMDLQERSGLRELLEMVDSVREAVIKQFEQQALEDEARGPEVIVDTVVSDIPSTPTDIPSTPVVESRDDAEVLEEMRNVQFGGDLNSELREQEEAQKKEEMEKLALEQAAAAKKTYLDLLATFLECPDAELTSMVTEKHTQCTMEFLEVALEQAKLPDQDGAKIQQIIDLVNAEANRQVQAATANLQMILTAGTPPAMEASIIKLGNENKLDETFLLLLRANIDQAKAAGAVEPAQVLEKLLNRAQMEIDRKKSPAQKLLSELMRTESSETRVQILTKAFTPNEKVLLSAQEEQGEAMPDVKPPDFIEASKAMIRKFGNMEIEKGVTVNDRVMRCVAEAEQVSTSIYGESMTAEEQQDRMWKDGTISIWDLETLEQQAEVMGETMPWHGDVDESKFMEGFNKKGQKLIGG